MNAIAHGCSFTRYFWPCWPTFVEWFTTYNVVNEGEPGSANETIARKVLNSAHNDPKHIYIMWSDTNRYEVWHRNGLIKTGGHPEPKHHKYYVKHFLHEGKNLYNTLEKILLVQTYLEKKKIPYTMMTWKGDIISDQFAIHKDIDWTKFVFYKDTKGLWEYAEENFAEYYLKGELHPPPIAHYHWVKDIMFKSDILCPENEYNKLKDYFKGKDGRSRI
jgi:hypothetical protein